MTTFDLLLVALPIAFVIWREQRQYRGRQALLRQRFLREIDSYGNAPRPRPRASHHLSPEERRARAVLYGPPQKIDVAPIDPPIESARIADTTGRATHERHNSHERP